MSPYFLRPMLKSSTSYLSPCSLSLYLPFTHCLLYLPLSIFHYSIYLLSTLIIFHLWKHCVGNTSLFIISLLTLPPSSPCSLLVIFPSSTQSVSLNKVIVVIWTVFIYVLVRIIRINMEVIFIWHKVKVILRIYNKQKAVTRRCINLVYREQQGDSVV